MCAKLANAKDTGKWAPVTYILWKINQKYMKTCIHPKEKSGPCEFCVCRGSWSEKDWFQEKIQDRNFLGYNSKRNSQRTIFQGELPKRKKKTPIPGENPKIETYSRRKSQDRNLFQERIPRKKPIPGENSKKETYSRRKSQDRNLFQERIPRKKPIPGENSKKETYSGRIPRKKPIQERIPKKKPIPGENSKT